MRLHTLKPAAGSIKNEKRIGRGQGSGKGGTAARGSKGARARTGYSQKRGFEGGQMPLHRRLPKFGFVNPFRIEYNIFNLEQLEHFAQKLKTDSFSPEFLVQHKLISKNHTLVKILGVGELKRAIHVKAHKFSESAKNAIIAAGGTATLIENKNEKAD